jgi:hypothetical protein
MSSTFKEHSDEAMDLIGFLELSWSVIVEEPSVRTIAR